MAIGNWRAKGAVRSKGGTAHAMSGVMSDQSELLKKRTMRFALDVCALIKKLPYDEPGPTAKRQLAKAATSVAFNYRASCRARSHAEFTAKIGIVAEESDEAQGWLGRASGNRRSGNVNPSTWQSNYQITQSPNHQIVSACRFDARIPVPEYPRYAGRTRRRGVRRRRGIRCGTDSRR